MPRFARLTDEVDQFRAVIEVIDAADSADLAARFHPSIAAEFVVVPSDAVAGSTTDGSIWTHPVAPTGSEPARRTAVTRTEYYGLFTPPEEAMIRIVAGEQVTAAALAAADATETQRLLAVASLAVMLRRTDALAPAQTIDLANPQVQAGLDLLVTMGLISAERRDEIAAGVID